MLTILLSILVTKLSVTACQVDLTTINEGHLDIRCDFKWIARGDDECPRLAWLDGSEPVALADDFCSIKCDTSQGGFTWKSMGCSCRGMVGKVSDMSRAISRCDAELDARFMQNTGQLMRRMWCDMP